MLVRNRLRGRCSKSNHGVVICQILARHKDKVDQGSPRRQCEMRRTSQSVRTTHRRTFTLHHHSLSQKRLERRTSSTTRASVAGQHQAAVHSFLSFATFNPSHHHVRPLPPRRPFGDSALRICTASTTREAWRQQRFHLPTRRHETNTLYGALRLPLRITWQLPRIHPMPAQRHDI